MNFTLTPHQEADAHLQDARHATTCWLIRTFDTAGEFPLVGLKGSCGRLLGPTTRSSWPFRDAVETPAEAECEFATSINFAGVTIAR